MFYIKILFFFIAKNVIRFIEVYIGLSSVFSVR